VIILSFTAHIGTTFHTKKGIMLYNPKTKQVIIRRSYQTLHEKDQTIPENVIPSILSTDSMVSPAKESVTSFRMTTQNQKIMQRYVIFFTYFDMWKITRSAGKPRPNTPRPLRSSRITSGKQTSPHSTSKLYWGWQGPQVPISSLSSISPIVSTVYSLMMIPFPFPAVLMVIRHLQIIWVQGYGTSFCWFWTPYRNFSDVSTNLRLPDWWQIKSSIIVVIVIWRRISSSPFFQKLIIPSRVSFDVRMNADEV